MRTEDDGGVHLNSSIVSYPAYLMHKDHISSGLTWDELAQVLYKSIHMWLSAASDYNDVRRCVVLAAQKMDFMTDEKLAIIKAVFDEVGIESQEENFGSVYSSVTEREQNILTTLGFSLQEKASK